MRARGVRAVSSVLITAITVTGVGLGTASAAAPPPAVVAQLSTAGVTSTTPGAGIDWGAIARAAYAAGDVQGARAAQQMERAANGQRVQVRAWNVLVKAAIKAALKHGRHLLPRVMRSWADKLYSWIDKIDNLKGAAMYMFLIKQGVPPDLAHTIVTWINTFV
jgi:hypothetical protein